MYRDVSQITFVDCNVIEDNDTIVTYDQANHYKDTYKLVTDTYYKTSREVYDAIPATKTCYTSVQLENLPSKFDAITPIYHGLAIVSALFLAYCAYRLILYPFFRKI